MRRDYWTEFWRAHGRKADALDPQTQVLRTYAKRPIDPERWERTVLFVERELRLGPDARLLDLCCGNGLFTERFAPHCAAVTAVDVAPELVARVEQAGLPNVEARVADVREVDFEDGSFDRVLVYAAIQYLDPREAVELLVRAARWLAPGGLLYLGDVPDAARRWVFFDTPEREAVHFDNLRAGTAIIGTWFEREWLAKACRYAGFESARALDQPPEMIYSSFRFELVATR
ncbi:MAG TPA: class I SAM-dependent methyltransferase [Planctomycetota bacterium]|nr:class I SAM-dependent methyltransferase [Planctomycetota bacterium]